MKGLNKKAATLLRKVEGKGKYFSFLSLPLPSPYNSLLSLLLLKT